MAIAAASPAFAQAPPGNLAASGALTRDDVQMRAATNFGMFDADEDGALTAKEISAPRQTTVNQNAITRRLVRDVFAEMDTDKNGWLSVAEYVGAINGQSPPSAGGDSKEFRRLDADRNARLTPNEFLQAIPPAAPLRIDGAMADYDSNKDGKITQIEFLARAMAEFDRMDLNKDGVIQGAEQTLKCTRGFGSPTFLDPAEPVRPMCEDERK